MSAPLAITEDDLQAYIDDTLEAARREQVRSYLADNPPVFRRVEGYRAQRLAQQVAFDAIGHEAPPEKLDLRQMIVTRATTRPPARRWAAIAVLILTLSAAGWYFRDAIVPNPNGVAALSREATDSYRTYAADRERPAALSATTRRQLAAAMSKQLKYRVTAPDLAAAGYQFVGGRTLATPHGAAALLIYGDQQGQPLSVLIRPMAVEKNARMSESADGVLRGMSWSRAGMGYSLVAMVPRDRLRLLALEARRQIRAR